MKLPFKHLSKESKIYLDKLNEMTEYDLDFSSTSPLCSSTYCDTVSDLLESLRRTVQRSEVPDEIKMLQYIYVYASIFELYSSFFDHLDEELDGKVADYFVNEEWITRVPRH